MSLYLYGKNEIGFQPLDIEAMTDEQAMEIAALIHNVALRYSELRELAPMSTRLQRALSWIHPKVVTLEDVRTRSSDAWRDQAAMSPTIYHELRDVVRPFGVRLPAWEMLP